MQLPPTKALAPFDRWNIRVTPGSSGTHHSASIPVLLGGEHPEPPCHRNDIGDLNRTKNIKLIALLITTQIIYHIIPMRISYTRIGHRPASNRTPLRWGKQTQRIPSMLPSTAPLLFGI